jgi:hypothetical protein
MSVAGREILELGLILYPAVIPVRLVLSCSRKTRHFTLSRKCRQISWTFAAS